VISLRFQHAASPHGGDNGCRLRRPHYEFQSVVLPKQHGIAVDCCSGQPAVPADDEQFCQEVISDREADGDRTV